ncbi:MAG: HigA family addiction module antitoxin [Pseudomonadota bacterium]
MTTYPARRPNRPPTHPGAILREDVLPALRISVAQAARDLGISRQGLHQILAERVSISSEMALKLGRFCGDGPDIWMRMQVAYDLWHARRKLGAALSAVPERHAQVQA